MENNEKEIDYTKPIKKRFFIIFTIIMYFVVFAVGYQVATFSYTKKIGTVPDDSIGKLNKVESLINENYYKPYDKGDIYEMTLAGMVAGLKDPYSYYLDEKSSTSFKEETINGEYVGIGVTLLPGEHDNLITVVAPFEGSPAQKAGIVANDKIYKINGEVFDYTDVDRAVSIMRGKKGEKVELEILRQGSEPITVTVEKGVIEVKSVEVNMVENENIARVRISRFDVTTYDDFMSELKAANINEETKLIIDLRGNPGGVVDSAVNIADSFIEEGRLLTIKYKNKEDEIYDAKAGSLKVKYPIAILADKTSASASEILTGALKDHKKAVLIGETTYGKGVVNQNFNIDGKTGIVLTIGEYLTPSGENIHKIGIKPDIEIKNEKTTASISQLPLEDDNQLQRAIEYLKENK